MLAGVLAVSVAQTPSAPAAAPTPAMYPAHQHTRAHLNQGPYDRIALSIALIRSIGFADVETLT
jgi:hypothetical protein